MHRFLSLSVLLMGLFAAASGFAADAPQPKSIVWSETTMPPVTPDELGPEIEQPIEFPHFRHAGDHDNEHPEKGGMEINCMYCHTFARRSAVAGIPPLQKCIGCHQSIESVRESPRIKKLFEYWDAKKPVPWKKVHDVPDFVRFNHERHIKRFVFQQNRPYQEVCGYCHGKVKEMTVARRQKAISMGWCVDCHKKDHPVTAEGGTPADGQAYWYAYRKPSVSPTGVITANGPNDCWQCHK